jgi:hypothetical protein
MTWVTRDAPMIKMDPMKIIGKGRGESAFVSEMDEAGIPDWWIESINPRQFFYSWVMSNHWETNYKAYQEGETTFRYMVIPHERPYSGPEAERAGREVCQPLIPVEVRPGAATPAPAFSFDSERLIVTSMRRADDGGLVLRVYNPGADAAKAKISGAGDQGISVHYCDTGGSCPEPAGSSIELPGYGVAVIRVGAAPAR